ncbi:MAG: glycerophosphodiester phosphodiesterase [Nitrospirae bacterium]|nr:glycerophosphodiester phosphodiesterase [Nitrospirota bacterium]
MYTKCENTIEAFEKAVSLGVSMIEFDVRKTMDHYLVCYHDEIAGSFRVSDMSYKDLLDQAKQNNCHIPLVEDIFKCCKGRMKLDIELKESGYEQAIVEMIKKHLSYSDFVVKSFSDQTIKTIKKLDRNITTGLLLGREKSKYNILSLISELFPEYRLLRSHADFVAPHFMLLRIGFLSRMRLLKKNVYVWAVNDEKNIQAMINKGVYALITDRIDLAIKLKTLHQGLVEK